MGDGDQNGGDQNGLEELNRAEVVQKIKILKTYQNSRNIKKMSMIKQWSNIKLFNKLFNYDSI